MTILVLGIVGDHPSELGGNNTGVHLGDIDNQLSGVGNNGAGAKESES